MRKTLLALLLAVSTGLSLHSADARAEGEVAPGFSLRNIDNAQVSLSDYKGKVVLVNFWATWCQPCMVEMPHIQKMYNDFKDRGFVVLSISTDDARSKSQVKPLIKRNGYTFPVLLDTDTKVVSQFNPSKVLPYTAIIDQEGRIRSVHQGYNPGDEVALRKEVEALLGPELPGGN